MEELKITQQAGVITANLDAIEAEITEQMKAYENYVVSEDSVKNDKKILADLRKLLKDLNDARIATKKKWLEPFDEFEARCKAVQAKVEEPINLINSQIKLFDEEKKLARQAEVQELFNANVQGYEKFISFEKAVADNPKWLNLSTKDSDILFDLNGMILKVKNDIEAIKALKSEIEEDCINIYAESGNNLSMAIQRNSQYLADKQKVVEQVKAEEPKEQPQEVEHKGMAQLNEMAKLVRTAKIIISLDDLEQVRETLNFMGVKYQVIEGE